MDESEQKVKIRKKNFPWSSGLTNFLLNFYDENKTKFLSAGCSQTKLWLKLTSQVIDSDLLSDEQKELFNPGTAKRRWLSLIRQFKFYFYESLKSKPKTNLDDFIYFRKMYKMFSDYAVQQLKMLDQENKNMQITSADVSRYLVNLLEGNQTLKECDLLVDTDHDTSTDLIKKFTSMPRKSISVFETKLKVVPNTPFNRNFQVNSVYKRVSILNARNSSVDHKKDETEHWQVEALEDSLVEVDQSSIQSISNVQDSSISIENLDPSLDFSSVKKIYQRPKTSTLQTQQNNSVEFESILEVPSCSSVDELRCEKPGNNSNQKFIIPTTMSRKRFTPSSTPIVIVPKKLKYDESIVQPEETESAPRWFQQFMFRYNEDMMRIDTQLQSISSRISNIEKTFYTTD